VNLGVKVDIMTVCHVRKRKIPVLWQSWNFRHWN